MTLATVSAEGEPYCANIFYAWLSDYSCFVFTSDHDTIHSRQALTNSRVAGSVVLETKIVGKVQGLQLQGVLQPVDANTPLSTAARKAFLLRFPYAAVMELSLWTLEPDFMKLTDNRLGFGKKLIWCKDE